MLAKGRGKIAAILLTRRKEKGGYDDEPESEETERSDGPDDGLVSAMEDLIAAVKRGDAEAAAEAFQDAHDQACGE